MGEQDGKILGISFKDVEVSNEDFLRAIFGTEWRRTHVCAFTEDPMQLDALGLRHYWAGGPAWRLLSTFVPDQNQYFTISLFKQDAKTNRARRKKDLHETTHCIVLDDVAAPGASVQQGSGTTAKVPWDKIKLKPSWVLETSPGNYQVGYILMLPDHRSGKVSALLDALVDSGLCSGGKDPGMKGVTRYVRLPEGTNRKGTYGVNGFKHRMVWWKPDNAVGLQEIADAYGVRKALEEAPDKLSSGARVKVSPGEDMVLDVLTRAGMVKQELSAGVWDIECPFMEHHTQRADSGAAYMSPDGFKCWHGHCVDKSSLEFLTKISADYPTEWAEARRDELERDFGDIGGAADPFEGLRLGVEDQMAGVIRDVALGKFGSVLRADQVLGMPLDLDGNWLVDQLLPVEALGTLYGAPGVGKTFVALDLAMRVASGMPWHGHDVDAPGKVVYVNSEGGDRTSAMRMRAWMEEHNGQAPPDFYMWAGALALGRGMVEDQKALVEWCRNELGGVRMVVIDTLNRNFVGDENSTEDMTAFVAAADWIRRELGCVVLVVHHSGKDAAKGLRGSSAWLGAVDAVIEVARDKDAGLSVPGEIRVTKLREAEDGLRYGFELKYRKLGVDRKLRDRGSLVAVEAAPPVAQVRLGENEKTVLDHIIQNPGLTFDGIRKDIPAKEIRKLKRVLEQLVEKELVEETPHGGYVAFEKDAES